VSSPKTGGRITLAVRVNPLILWLWIGGLVMALGTILALAPRLRRRVRPVVAPVVAPAGSAPPAPADAAEEVPA
jgi:cytochrome c-type biogenesis protein CcmF